MTREEAQALFAQGEEPVIGKLLEQDTRIRELEGRCATDSHNSSKPPSTDGFHKPAPKSLRKKIGRKPGGQKGHRGSTLALSDKPDEVVPHPLPACPCGCDLSKRSPEAIERRQVHDFPRPRMHVTEHRYEIKTCPDCHRVVSSAQDAPKDISAPVQYGPRILALCVYLKTYQLLPFKRCAELIRELFGGTLCEGTLAKMISKVGDSLEAPLAAIREMLIGSGVAHFDETGVSVRGKRHWLHVASTSKVTLYTIHSKRGTKAMDAMGVLPYFKGRAIHDHWKPYYTYKGCRHGLCNVHHLRELTFVDEQMHQPWARLMMDLLIQIKSAVDTAKASNLREFDDKTTTAFKRRYVAIIATGIAANPAPVPVPGRRGKPKDTKSGNLVRRLKGHRQEVLAFMYDFSVPFGNNIAERDLRMMKVQQKISGTFRADVGGVTFCRIRSYLSTAAKHCLSALDVLAMAIKGSPFMPISD